MRRRDVLAGGLCSTWLLCSQAYADAIPPAHHWVGYKFVIENLDDFPDHIFYVYPTSNSGVAYQVEKDRDVTPRMSINDWKGQASALYAISKSEFEREKVERKEGPHGAYDGRGPGRKRKTLAFFSPPKGGRRANLPVEPPLRLVPDDNPTMRVEKTFRISKLSADQFELEVTSEIHVHRDGSRHEVASVPPTASATPAKTSPKDAADAGAGGCSGCATHVGQPPSASNVLPWLALILVKRWRGAGRTEARASSTTAHDAEPDGNLRANGE